MVAEEPLVTVKGFAAEHLVDVALLGRGAAVAEAKGVADDHGAVAHDHLRVGADVHPEVVAADEPGLVHADVATVDDARTVVSLAALEVELLDPEQDVRLQVVARRGLRVGGRRSQDMTDNEQPDGEHGAHSPPTLGGSAWGRRHLGPRSPATRTPTSVCPSR
jgi:hypothetical protein